MIRRSLTDCGFKSAKAAESITRCSTAHFAPECGRGKRDYMRDKLLLTDEGFGHLGWSVLHSESPLRFVETLCLVRSS
jgi:hypothetical protein